MTDYEAWLECKNEDSREMQFELSIHRCPKCGKPMREVKESYNLNEPYYDEWWQCENEDCDYREDI